MNKIKILENMVRAEVKKQLNEGAVNYSSFVKKLGITAASVPKYQQEPVMVKVVDIDPSTLGLFAPPFTKITLEVEGKWHNRNGKEVLVLYLDYRYEYTDGGRNGHDMRLISEDNGKSWEIL